MPTPQKEQHKPHVFKKADRVPNDQRGIVRTRGQNAVELYKGHVSVPEPVKTAAMVDAARKHELDLCAGYSMIFGKPRERVMDSASIARHVRHASEKREARDEMELYAKNAAPPKPKESDYRRNDPSRQVLDPRTHRPLIETVLSDDNTVMPPRTTGMRSFPQAYRNTEVDAADIPRAARHEMESMPASYKTNLVRTLCMLYPKFTAESRVARQKAAHRCDGGGPGGNKSQCLQHSPSRAGNAEKAAKMATAEVTSRPNNVRVVALMRASGGNCP